MRSLILAGGGMKVGYQAGCLQVLLDELGLQFDHVDAASGGCMNAAMLANGMSGTQVADAWRTIDPAVFTTLNLCEYYKGPLAQSIGTADGVKRAFCQWRLDYKRINKKQSCTYTFNCFDFTTKSLLTLENTAMDEEYLLAAVALPMWFPPVQKDGHILFDGVFVTDGNVGEAVRRGADEIWAIWTVSDISEYRDGFFAQYFHIIETVANARFKDEWREIAAVNAAIAAKGADTSRSSTDLRLRQGFADDDPELVPPPGRKHVDQHLIKQEVPVHYVGILSRDRMVAAVELGVRDTREYARSVLGRKVSVPAILTEKPSSNPVSLEFTETMRGFFMPADVDCRHAARRGKAAGNGLTVQLRVGTNDLDTFLTEPQHECGINGYVDAPLLSAGSMFTTAGTFRLFVNDRTADAPARIVTAHKKMLYTLRFTAQDGTNYLLEGEKIVNDESGFTPWRDTTILYIRLFTIDAAGQQQFYGSGILRVLLLDFLKELTTIKAGNVSNEVECALAVARFGRFFFGQLWDVYLRWILDYAPV